MKFLLKYCCFLAVLNEFWHANAYSAIPYTSNRISLGYSVEKTLNRPHMHSHHYQRLPIKQQQQQTHLSLPFYNFNANLRKKPTTKLAHYNNNNNNNMLMYNKRYKRFPPYQAMPEIPIKKPIGRYLPYTPLYHMNVITPSLLIPFYMSAGKAPRFIGKPSMYDMPTTMKIKPTMPTTSSSSYLPANDLLYNYLRLLGVNKMKSGNQQTISKTTSTIPTTTMATATTSMATMSLKPTTSNRAVNMLGNFHVESKIKFLDSPFSATNVRQRQQQQQQHHHQTYTISKYNNNDNNMATHFHLPIMPVTTTISSYFPSATTTATSFLALPYRMQQFKQMPMDIILKNEDNEKELDFVPTWYPYAKPQKSKNFFTIADAITPYKPIEPITMAYQPYYYDIQTEHYANVKPTTMGFRPVHDIYGTYTQSRTTQDYVRTTSMPLVDNLNQMNKWRAIKESNEEEEKFFENINTTTAAIKTTNLQQQDEINFTTKASITTKNSTNNIEQHETKAKINRMRLSSYSTSKIEKPQTKKPKSFFDDWFADDDFVETTVPTTHIEMVTITPTMTTTTTKKTISTKLKWANKRRTKTHLLKNDTFITTTTTTPSAVATTAEATGVVKKPRKKYANIKNKQNRNKLTTTNNVNNEKMNLNNTKKFTKRIKKVLRVRPTLLPVLKLKQKSTKPETLKEFNTELPTTISETITTAINKNIHEITIMPTTTTTTSTTTPATTAATTTTTGKTTIHLLQERTSRDPTQQRKRGRHTYTYNNQNQKATEETKRNNHRIGSSSTERAQEARYQTSKRHSRTRTSTTTTTTTSTAIAPTHRSLATSRSHHMRDKQPLSSTAESAIMKISQNNSNSNRNKRIQNMLDNLMIPATTQSTLQSNTEIPPLPIELYFQKMKSGYE